MFATLKLAAVLAKGFRRCIALGRLAFVLFSQPLARRADTFYNLCRGLPRLMQVALVPLSPGVPASRATVVPPIMQLFNSTPLSAKAYVDILDQLASERVVMVHAKATLRFDERGQLSLDGADPLPIFDQDQSTPLGALPSDALPAPSARFQVVCLGQAHAPEPTTHLRVALSVGATRRELLVVGDRRWGQAHGHDVVTRPLPFRSMPLSWDRAYGGQCTVEVDKGALMPVRWPFNPHGRGFNAPALIAQIAEALQCPEGYPRFEYELWLPNIEAPQEPMRSVSDMPMPVCWATLPRDVPLHLLRGMAASPERPLFVDPPPWQQCDAAVVRAGEGGEGVLPMPLAMLPGPTAEDLRTLVTAGALRAHPDWVLEPPAFPLAIRFEGLLAQCRDLRIELPDLDVRLDYQLGDAGGSCSAEPYLLCLLPEERRLCVVYEAMVRAPLRPVDERALRLRYNDRSLPVHHRAGAVP